jgi:hypothetical protein
MTVEITLDHERFHRDVAIDGNDLNRGFLEHAGLFAYYASAHVKAMRAEGQAKIRVELTESKVGKALREKALADGTKMTEKQLEELVSLDAEVIKARLAYVNAKATTQLAQHAVEAFRQRRDMLIQIGASAREELKGDVRAANVERLRGMIGA